jgi:hypothetical protein
MLTSDEVRRLCGDLPDWKVAKIIASEASYQELEAAVLWAQGENQGPDHPLEGKVADLYEIITADEEWEDDRDR